jgi:hypothetical protein
MDQWRLKASLRTDPWSGQIEDEAEKFFGRSPWLVGSGDLWRWRAACEALRELIKR